MYDRWLDEGLPRGLQSLLSWDRDRFWQAILDNHDHDERAGLVCALTAVCVLRGSYVAVGEPFGGYFFLPWAKWAPWAQAAVDKARADRRLPAPVDLWIDGMRYDPGDQLPKQ